MLYFQMIYTYAKTGNKAGLNALLNNIEEPCCIDEIEENTGLTATAKLAIEYYLAQKQGNDEESKQCAKAIDLLVALGARLSHINHGNNLVYTYIADSNRLAHSMYTHKQDVSSPNNGISLIKRFIHHLHTYIPHIHELQANTNIEVNPLTNPIAEALQCFLNDGCSASILLQSLARHGAIELALTPAKILSEALKLGVINKDDKIKRVPDIKKLSEIKRNIPSVIFGAYAGGYGQQLCQHKESKTKITIIYELGECTEITAHNSLWAMLGSVHGGQLEQAESLYNLLSDNRTNFTGDNKARSDALKKNIPNYYAAQLFLCGFWTKAKILCEQNRLDERVLLSGLYRPNPLNSFDGTPPLKKPEHAMTEAATDNPLMSEEGLILVGENCAIKKIYAEHPYVKLKYSANAGLLGNDNLSNDDNNSTEAGSDNDDNTMQTDPGDNDSIRQAHSDKHNNTEEVRLDLLQSNLFLCLPPKMMIQTLISYSERDQGMTMIGLIEVKPELHDYLFNLASLRKQIELIKYELDFLNYLLTINIDFIHAHRLVHLAKLAPAILFEQIQTSKYDKLLQLMTSRCRLALQAVNQSQLQQQPQPVTTPYWQPAATTETGPVPHEPRPELNQRPFQQLGKKRPRDTKQATSEKRRKISP